MVMVDKPVIKKQAMGTNFSTKPPPYQTQTSQGQLHSEHLQ